MQLASVDDSETVLVLDSLEPAAACLFGRLRFWQKYAYFILIQRSLALLRAGIVSRDEEECQMCVNKWPKQT